MLSVKLGKVSVEVHGGARSIGGNCVVVRDEKSGFAVMLDQGLNFRAFTRYYGGYIEPQSLRDLYEVKAIPSPEAYEGVDAVFVSHLHLDHLGALSMAEEQRVELYVPHVGILAELTESWEWSWRSILLPSTESVIDYARSIKEWRGIVKPVRVSHSAYPSYAFLLHTSSGSVLYTGDFRLDTPLKALGVEHDLDTSANLGKIVEEVGGIDLAIVEGTNLGGVRDYVDVETASLVLGKLLESYSRKVLFLTYHPLDVETFAFVANLLTKRGWSIAVVHERYVDIADASLTDMGLDQDQYFYYDIHGEARRHGYTLFDYVGSVRSCRLVESIPSDKIAVFLSYRVVDELRILANQGIDLRGSLLIQLTSEPRDEEYRMMEAKVGAWLTRFGIHSYRIRISGHYYPHQLNRVLEIIKPKKIVPIHTTHPEMLIKT
ncbi:MAG: MBL fold metallo-hydrolase [Desulfurococcaceae archaeon]